MPRRTCLAIVLAAGEGTRMRSSTPKVLHELGGPLAARARDDDGERGRRRRLWPWWSARTTRRWQRRRSHLRRRRRFSSNASGSGTAHAVLSARKAIAEGADDILVMFADTPLVRADTLAKLRNALAEGAAVAVLGFKPANPHGYGRLVMRGREPRCHPRGARCHTGRAHDRPLQWRPDGACR